MQLTVDASRCVACVACVRACPTDAIALPPEARAVEIVEPGSPFDLGDRRRCYPGGREQAKPLGDQPASGGVALRHSVTVSW